MNFLLSYAGKFDMYVEDECAAYVRYCFADPLDAAIFRSRFEPKAIQAGLLRGAHLAFAALAELIGRHRFPPHFQKRLIVLRTAS